MKAIDHKTYDREEPELFDWNLLESEAMSDLGNALADAAVDNINGNPTLIPGLQTAMNLLAKIADLIENKEKQ